MHKPMATETDHSQFSGPENHEHLPPPIVDTVIIENISENYDRGLDDAPDTAKKYWRIHDQHYGHRCLFYEGDSKIVVTTAPVPIAA